MEIIDAMNRRKINFMCQHETKWVGEKVKELKSSRLKHWYTRKVRSRNGVDIILDKELKKDIVNVERIVDCIVAHKFVLE